jgi:hypothetical protein
MRYLPLLFATLVHTACSTALVTRSEAQAASPAEKPVSEMQKASRDSVVQFLLTATAADFHIHGPSGPVRFRNVRIGHVMTPGAVAQYMLCGQFRRPKEKGQSPWIPFTTIKTSGYETWLGAQAAAFCQDSWVIWDKVNDLSSSLQSRFDSLR